MNREKYHLYTFSLDGWMRQFNTKFIMEFNSYNDALNHAKNIDLNPDYINYTFAIYKTTYLEQSNEDN